YASAWADDDIQFDSRFLELKGDTKIDLKRFSSQGYVEPGKYNLTVQVNKQPLPDEYDIFWYASEKEAGKTYACLTPALLAQFGLKEEIAKNLQWSRNGECLAPGQLEGIDIKADLSQSALLISLPQAYLEYSDMDWDPPSRWDDGIPGLIADYSINAQTRSGDDDEDSDGNSTQRNWEWSRYYAWRALPSLKAKLALGEDYLNSDIFDGFNYVGGSVSTDDQMLPPNLRGYAPDISGVAHTTAKVTVSQMGRVIYETQVPAGPFRIQDLGDSVSGTLHVRIEEQNGQVQEYDISTASMPFLTRQGQVRYKVMMGRPQEWGHNI
ncbi:TPA: fimbria/pilus outer membrane usher protein, partial [Escherichia coli]